jgi:hypothetical protein
MPGIEFGVHQVETFEYTVHPANCPLEKQALDELGQIFSYQHNKGAQEEEALKSEYSKEKKQT